MEWEHEGVLATCEWPIVPSADPKRGAAFETVKALIAEIRSTLKNVGLQRGALVYAPNDLIAENSEIIKRMARLDSLEESGQGSGLKLTGLVFDAWLVLDPEVARRYADTLKTKQQTEVEAVARLEARLNTKSYVDNAPAAVVAETRKQLAEAQQRLESIRQEAKRLES